MFSRSLASSYVLNFVKGLLNVLKVLVSTSAHIAELLGKIGYLRVGGLELVLQGFLFGLSVGKVALVAFEAVLGFLIFIAEVFVDLSLCE
ncbi:hypothetical protein PTT_07088 [Pyrenophora teres f. teres 0-1]|uniref:Uncharacterized protein n=1 Tax=Pyrenophora teres f. teres (strain 0-1) TaxID=861557 RepID=E3RGX0_PYRTT|nr:hypothetical protein PTT_07088 [Pyrenophora teres f. teres 0-1]